MICSVNTAFKIMVGIPSPISKLILLSQVALFIFYTLITGKMFVTNLRVMWISLAHSRINLCE